MSENKIIVIIEGGTVQNVVRHGEGAQAVAVEIHDYDTDGCEPEGFTYDECGDPYHLIEF